MTRRPSSGRVPAPTVRGRGQRAQTRACNDCGKPLGRWNRSGVCHPCSMRARRVADEPLTAAERTRRYRDSRNLPPSPGRDHLLVACWCRAHYDYVHTDVIRAGSTWTCHLPQCEEQARG